MKIVLFTVLLAIYCSTANVILRYSNSADEFFQKDARVVDYGISKHSLFDRKLNSRDGRSKCSAPKRGPGIAERSLVVSFDNSTIDRRMKLPTPENIAKYIRDETNEAEPVVWGVRDTNAAKTEYDVNTSLFEEYKFYQNDDGLSLSATHLTGCTMLAIISRKGIWIGHFWENIAFATDEDNQFWERYNEDQDKIFEETVIKGMRNGKGSGENKQQDSLRLAAPKLDDDHIKAYLVHPSSNWKENGDYRLYWDRMKAEAVTHIPKLGQPDRWVEQAYEPTSNKRILRYTPRGRLLFKYDAKHRSETSSGGASGTQQLAMLWSETTELHRDAW